MTTALALAERELMQWYPFSLNAPPQPSMCWYRVVGVTVMTGVPEAAESVIGVFQVPFAASVVCLQLVVVKVGVPQNLNQLTLNRLLMLYEPTPPTKTR
jgi:hypothetical protein